jgi:hypothetical protein
MYVDPTGHWREGDEIYSREAQAQIVEATKEYNEAKKKGIKEAMKAAEAKANAAREGIIYKSRSYSINSLKEEIDLILNCEYVSKSAKASLSGSNIKKLSEKPTNTIEVFNSLMILTQINNIRNNSKTINPFQKGPTVFEAAELADHVYFTKSVDKAKKDSLLGDWKLSEVYDKPSLRIGVYQRLKNGEIEYVLVNRGTQNWAWNGDTDDNVKQLFGGSDDMKNSIAYAQEFVKKIL